MLNFRDHFFAVFKLPKVVQHDFRAWKTLPWADLGVTVYIPAKNHLIRLDIHTQNALRNYQMGQGDSSCLFSLESAACSIPHIESYYKSDESYLNTLVNSNDRFPNSSKIYSHSF